MASGAVVLNLPLRRSESFTPGLAWIADLHLIARTAEKDRTEAISLLLATVKRQESKSVDWPDELASALMQNPSQILSRWGIRNGLAAWTLSRGFVRVFGISPEAFRARVRAGQALYRDHSGTAGKDRRRFGIFRPVPHDPRRETTDRHGAKGVAAGCK